MHTLKSIITAFPLLALTLSTGVHSHLINPRQNTCSSSTYNANNQQINQDVIDLKTAVDKYQGGFPDAVAVQNAYKKTNDDIKTATNNVNSCTSLTGSEASQIANYCINTLAPNVKKAAQSIASKSSSSGLLKQGGCSDLADNLDNLALVWFSKSPSAQLSAAQTCRNSLSAATKPCDTSSGPV